MSQSYIYPSGFSTVSIPAVGTNGSTIPLSSMLVAGENPSHDLIPLQVDSSGNLLVSPLTSSSTVKAQLQDNNGTPIILGQTTMSSSLPVAIASDQSSIPVTFSGNVTVVQPTGTNLHTVVDSGSISASQFGTWTTRIEDTSGSSLTSTGNALDINLKTSSITLNTNASQAGTWNVNNVTGTVSLPTGASTSALQTQISGQLPTTLGSTTSANSLSVTLASDQSPISDKTTSGNITSTQSVSISTLGYGTVSGIISGTWSGTLTIEASVDGTNWVTTTGTEVQSGIIFSNTSSNLSFQSLSSGFNSIRIRGNTVATGTANIYLRASIPVSQFMLDNPLPGGTNTIGSILNINGTVSLPTGAATASNQTTGNSSLSTIATNTTGLNATIAATSSSVPADALQVGVKNGSNLVPITEGQATMANSLPVVIASDQSTINVTGSTTVSGTVAATQSGNWSTRTQDGSGNAITSTSNSLDINLKTSSITLPVSGSGNFTVVQGTGTNLHTVVDSGTITANQGTANATPWNENIAQFGGSAVVTGTGASGSGIPRVTISNDSSLAANQSVNMNQVGGSSVTLGSKTSANSIPVVVASDQAAVAVKGSLSPTTGRSSANAPVQNIYSSVNITTSAYVQLVASTTSTTNYLDIFDSSGQAMILGVGGAGVEVIQAYVPPGGDQIPLAIPSGSRVAYKALSANATSGYLLMNFYT